MNIANVDLNLLIYLDVLLREQNVTRAANQLKITQPAMSNGLKRLRTLLNDPLLVRTSDGMSPTEKARTLQPVVRRILLELEEALQPSTEFIPETSDRVYRIMASDYAASTLLPPLLSRLSDEAPNVALDIMTPSDVTFHDVEAGKIDMAINRFEDLPISFHQKRIWMDEFVCLTHKDAIAGDVVTLDEYLEAQHIWVSKTGFGVGVGMDTTDVSKLGWVDDALTDIGKKRKIAVFTRNYHVAMQLALKKHMIVTVPKRATSNYQQFDNVLISKAPISIPEMELKMIWSPLLHHDASHIWLRRLINEVAHETTSAS
ncbi:LysR family transcriptional regulator [Saccharobesus litoralis]|uniref:LysR family transcriptional regulator n=1 Tax=Saccharobesus litoralis TaxID=2172099 RepID=A0A2S0VU24_9ALTE|nr:LysR family transcriptional regulator [Saccharobesus litoralis]AWB67705.1 LysR family transcriptional regulator [Saccharobesus litoralis]